MDPQADLQGMAEQGEGALSEAPQWCSPVYGPTMKTCLKCRTEKDLSEFNKASRNKDGLNVWCRVCMNAYVRVLHQKNYFKHRITQNLWRKNNPDKLRAISWRKAGINLTPAEHKILLAAQEEKCRICRRHQSEFKRPLSADHDHVTGKIRGLLCGRCNTGLGQFQDDPERMIAAANYIRGTL